MGRLTWDDEAATFDEEPDHGLRDPAVRAAWRDLLVAGLPPAPALIADLGCGTGTLSLLLAEQGHRVDGLDRSPAMLENARTKLRDQPGATFTEGDASDPSLPSPAYDVVLGRHVLWALPDPALALQRWVDLLTPDGRLILIEGRWFNDAGLTSEETVALVGTTGLVPEVTAMPEARYWSRDITDERYLVLARR